MLANHKFKSNNAIWKTIPFIRGIISNKYCKTRGQISGHMRVKKKGLQTGFSPFIPEESSVNLGRFSDYTFGIFAAPSEGPLSYRVGLTRVGDVSNAAETCRRPPNLS